MDGRWDEARAHIAIATKYHTQNSLIDYHAGIIAAHFNDQTAAKADFEAALALNPSFDAVFADDARARVAAL